MGHEHFTLTGTGKNRQEAYNRALDAFFYENGHRYSVSNHLGEKRLEDVPPIESVETITGRTHSIHFEPNPAAPRDRWLQQWEFHVDFHV